MDEVDGYTEIENGMGEADKELHLIIDEDALTKKGFTVAQLYQELSGMLNTSTTSSKLTVDDKQMQVEIIDETHVPTREDILDTVVTLTSQAGETVDVKIGDVARVEEGVASNAIVHLNSDKTMTVSAEIEDGHNNALLSRELSEKLDAYEVPDKYQIYHGGELDHTEHHVGADALVLPDLQLRAHLFDHGGAVPKPPFAPHHHPYCSVGLHGPFFARGSVAKALLCSRSWALRC